MNGYSARRASLALASGYPSRQVEVELGVRPEVGCGTGDWRVQGAVRQSDQKVGMLCGKAGLLLSDTSRRLQITISKMTDLRLTPNGETAIPQHKCEV